MKIIKREISMNWKSIKIIVYLFIIIVLTWTSVFGYQEKKIDIVMYGDSITFGGDWVDLLKRENIINRGIVADTTEGFILRLDEIFTFNPKICFIMGGINDIAKGVPIEEIYSNIIIIIETLKTKKITPIVQSTLYTRKLKYNEKVWILNKLLADYARREGITFIDVNKKLAKNNKILNKYTFDGIHLSKNAYILWAGELRKILKIFEL